MLSAGCITGLNIAPGFDGSVRCSSSSTTDETRHLWRSLSRLTPTRLRVTQRRLPRQRVADAGLGGTSTSTHAASEYPTEDGTERRAEHGVDDWIGQRRRVA